MYNIIKESHNNIGMLLLILLLVVFLLILIRFLLKKPWNKSTSVIALVGMVLTHVQILVGGVLYFLSPLGLSNVSGVAMGHKISRFYILEHPIGMIIAAILMTIGYNSTQKNHLSDTQKYKKILIYYLLAVGIVVYLIPWFLWS